MLEKSQIWVDTYPVSGLPIQKLNICNSSQKTLKSKYQTLFSCPNLLDFSNFSKYFVRDCRMYEKLLILDKSYLIYVIYKVEIFHVLGP